MREQLFKIISKYGMKCQFGSTPKVGCQDGTFMIKNNTAPTSQPKSTNMGVICRPIQGLRHIQPCITHSHSGKIWHPPILYSTIKHINYNIVVQLIIGKIETDIYFKVGVKQGKNMASVLFLFLMMAFSETL